MASTTGDGVFQAHFEKNKLTLNLTKKGRRVLGVTFHDTTSWCHVITWICTLIPDEYSPYINVKFLQQLSALKEKFATHGRLTSIQIDRRMFVFRHETEDKAIEMLGSYTLIEEIILMFLRETGAQVTHITMKSEVDEAPASIDQETLPRGTTDQDVLFSSKHEDDVDAPHSHPQQRHDDIPHAQEDEEASHPHAQKDEDAAHLSTGSVRYTGMTDNSRTDKSISAGKIRTKEIHQDNRTVNNKIIINPPSGKAVVESCWKAKHENIPQPTGSDNETLKTLLKERFPDSLVAVWWECMVFCFEHESMEDAVGMIVQHADIKEDILHFLQKLNPSINDIVMEVEVRELSESEEQTAETSETRPRGMTDPEHKGEEGTSRSHPQQKDETSHLHIQETGDDSSSLSHSPQKKKKYEDTCLPHPQETEEDKTSLQQTDEDTSHPHPQKTEEDETPLQQTDEYTCLPHPQKTEEDKTPLQQTDEYTSHLHPQKTEEDETPLQQTDEDTSHQHPQKTEEDETSLQQTDEYTSHPHPQKTEEDETSLQQTDEYTSHLQPQEVYVKDKFKYQPIKIEKESHSSGYTSSDPSLKPLVKGQDSDRRASSDPSQGHSQSEEDPLLSTASHATPSQADRDLYWASYAGNLEEVKRLLSTPGIDVDCRVGELSLTPVMAAAYKGHREVVELLVSEGADVSLVDVFGNNILHLACRGEDVETVKYVLSLNVVDINARNMWGRTAADRARLRGPQQVVELLVSRGAQ